jgi:hypothetical protein
VSLPDHQNPTNRGVDWPAVVRTLLVQVLVLLALTGAFIGYVNWSSEQAVWELMNAGEPALQEPHRASEVAAPVQAVKDQALCRRKDEKIEWQALRPEAQDVNGRDEARP